MTQYIESIWYSESSLNGSCLYNYHYYKERVFHQLSFLFFVVHIKTDFLDLGDLIKIFRSANMNIQNPHMGSQCGKLL